VKVLFIHGLESSPQGNKARYLAQHFEAHTPAMDTGDFQACYEQQVKEVAAVEPDIVVGSSFGGARAVLMLGQGAWAGPTLLLAQASARFDTSLVLPERVPVLLVHGTRDEVIDIEGSRRLARTGTPGLVRLVEVDDTHRLDSLVVTGRLADLVRDVAALRP
jgi:alpha/beta superfamily hydrolase